TPPVPRPCRARCSRRDRSRRRPASVLLRRRLGIVDRRELYVDLVEAPEDPRRLVAEPAIRRRAVVLLGQPDVTGAVEDPLEADPALGAGQRATRAGV